jgi:crotonobetainyl-CoA:carnitine CoA-transferase CaiB-like acyl-CoA transferase
MIFADYGAEVVRVEPPGGGLTRRSGVATSWDRGKRSLVAELGDPADLEVLGALARAADVIIVGADLEPTRGSGLDYETLAAANPALVYCKLAAYGPRESDDASNTHDFLANARLGVMSLMPGHRDGPIAPGSPALTYSTGLMAAIAILAAVRARLVTGQGDRVEVSHEDGFLALRTMAWKSEHGSNFVAKKSRSGDLDTGRLRLILRMFECANGGRVQIHTGAAGAFGRAMQVLGLSDRLSRPEGTHEMATPLTDEDLKVLANVPAIFKTKTADEWCALFWANEVACLPVLPPGLAFNDPQVRHAGVMRTIVDPIEGEIEVVGPVVDFAASAGAIRGPAPTLGQDSNELRLHGWASDGLGLGLKRGRLEHPLDGVRIVEVSSYFASPYGSRLLASLGAEVIKVEPVGGDVFRAMVDPFEGANRGKRDIAFDLKAPEGRDITAALLATADVVQSNMRPGTCERLGVDYACARRANPNVIYHFAPGYGSTGPKANLQAFAPLLSGFVGVLTSFGGPGNAPHMGFGNEDFFGGQITAISVLMALAHRERTGEGQYLEGPLLHSALLITSEWYLKDGIPRTGGPQLDAEQTGFGPFHRLYQCLDGWIAVACTTDYQRQALIRAVIDASMGVDLNESEIASALTYEFFSAPASDWIRTLRAARVPSVQVFEGDYYDEYLSTDPLVAAGRIFESVHGIAGRVRGPDLMFRASRHRGLSRDPAPALGAHSREILGELGMDDRADELVDRGLVVIPADVRAPLTADQTLAVGP